MEAELATADVAAKPAKPPLFVKDMTLSEAYNKMQAQYLFSPKTPLAVFLMENPASPLGIPGAIDLREHDFMHCLLNQPLNVKGEAFVIGFTMGADPALKSWHTWLFKFVAKRFYPKAFRFKDKHMEVFDRAVALGKQSRIKDFAHFDFNAYMDARLADLRALIAVDEIVTQP